MWSLPKFCFCYQVFVNVNGWCDIWYCWLEVVTSRTCVFTVREVCQTSHVTSRQSWHTVLSWHYAEQTELHVGCILMTLCTLCTMMMAVAAAISSLSRAVCTKMSTTGGLSNIHTCNTAYIFLVVCHSYWSYTCCLVYVLFLLLYFINLITLYCLTSTTCCRRFRMTWSVLHVVCISFSSFMLLAVSHI